MKTRHPSWYNASAETSFLNDDLPADIAAPDDDDDSSQSVATVEPAPLATPPPKPSTPAGSTNFLDGLLTNFEKNPGAALTSVVTLGTTAAQAAKGIKNKKGGGTTPSSSNAPKIGAKPKSTFMGMSTPVAIGVGVAFLALVSLGIYSLVTSSSATAAPQPA